jgi:circadian clock protein KaiB
MKTNPTTLPDIFKGIALFTPGGDLIYCIDSEKQSRWHLHLVVGLQELLGLSEPPHFLLPNYTATVDNFWDSESGKIVTYGEIHAQVKRYQSLLNVLFKTSDRTWKVAPWQGETSSPILLESYQRQFPQLWENHNLIVNYEFKKSSSEYFLVDRANLGLVEKPQGYVLRLFVAGNSISTKQTLETIHQLLERELGQPYTLKVVDISKDPEQAELNHVSAIPTLVRVFPEPVRRIVGEFHDPAQILHLIAAG